VARQALTAEILANNSNLLARRIAIAPCVDSRLDKAETIITALEVKQVPDPFPDFRLPSGFLTIDSEWQAERASQVLTHFPRNELANFSRYYAQLPDFGGWLHSEEIAWAELSILQRPPTNMTATDLNKLRINLFIARRIAGLINRNAHRELSISERLGVAEVKVDDPQVKNFCSDMSWTDYLRWQRSQQPIDIR
jgi:hypothetical protein